MPLIDTGRLEGIARRIWEDAAGRGFRGPDPYDGLNSRLLRGLLPHSRALRLVVIQTVMRCPLDMRPLLSIPPGLNPKSLALFLSGAASAPGLEGVDRLSGMIEDTLLSLASGPDGSPAWSEGRRLSEGIAERLAETPPGKAGPAGWGYDFPWQGRAFLQDAWSPTVVTTGFVTEALAAAGRPSAGFALASAAGFVSRSLARFQCDDGVCFSYSPGDETRVYNASLIGARILARASGVVDRPEYRDLAAKAADYVVSRQGTDGSWAYGEAPHWRWTDGFHTGYVLEALEDLSSLLSTDRWDGSIRAGLRFYRTRLFLEDGTARYFSHRTLPLDPHSAAQGAITFIALRRHLPDAAGFARRIVCRAVERLWDDRRGGFVFRKGRLLTNRTIHTRWSQAWMFRAVCSLLRQEETG